MMKYFILFFCLSNYSFANELANNFELANAEQSHKFIEDYERKEIQPFLSQHFKEVTTKCANLLEQAFLTQNEYILAIDLGGKVLKGYTKNSSKMADCIMSGLVTLKFPVPSVEPYYTRIVVQFDLPHNMGSTNEEHDFERLSP